MKRCDWATKNELEKNYHDKEWGVAVYNDRLLFEMLTLEGAQAGLSWATILAKREGYKELFDNFDIKKVSSFDEKKVEILLQSPKIVRNKPKVNSTINNAKMVLKLQEEFGSFSNYIWGFVDNKPIINSWGKIEDVPTFTKLSDKISKDMKKRGFKFVGSTTIYAFLQSIGVVNDHLTYCFCYNSN